MEGTPLFKLGRIVVTPAALGWLERFAVDVFALLQRHQCGDWGLVCEEDSKANDRAVAHGARVLSSYAIDPSQPSRGHGDNTLWIITEADRSATTVLLPDDY
jgi:hypothetical protein